MKKTPEDIIFKMFTLNDITSCMVPEIWTATD